jgi:hypothetical protein
LEYIDRDDVEGGSMDGLRQSSLQLTTELGKVLLANNPYVGVELN